MVSLAMVVVWMTGSADVGEESFLGCLPLSIDGPAVVVCGGLLHQSHAAEYNQLPNRP